MTGPLSQTRPNGPRRQLTVFDSTCVVVGTTLALVVGFGWYEPGFDRLLHFITPVFWFFASPVAVSLFVLRCKEPHVPRTYHVLL